MTTTFNFYNNGIAKQDVSWNIQLFAETFQGGNIDGYFETDAASLTEILALLRKLIMENHFLAFAGEQMALANHIIDCLGATRFSSTIQKSALSSDDSNWDKMAVIITGIYNERFA